MLKRGRVLQHQIKWRFMFFCILYAFNYSYKQSLSLSLSLSLVICDLFTISLFSFLVVFLTLSRENGGSLVGSFVGRIYNSCFLIHRKMHLQISNISKYQYWTISKHHSTLLEVDFLVVCNKIISLYHGNRAYILWNSGQVFQFYIVLLDNRDGCAL